MKAAAAGLVALAVALVAWSAIKGGVPLVQQGLRASGRGALQLVPLLAVVLLLAGFVEVLIPRAIVATWLSEAAGVRGLLVAWVAGALTPGGGPIGLPVAAALMRSGAGPGVLVTYLTSLSLLSFVRVPLEVGIYGGRLTGLRVLSSLLLPLIAGGFAQLFVRLTR